MAFRIGQEVQCVRSGEWWRQEPDRWNALPVPGPKKKDDILRIAAVHHIDGDVWLQFAEWPHGAYEAVRFRAVVRTDISIFLAMLRKAPKRARERKQVAA